MAHDGADTSVPIADALMVQAQSLTAQTAYPDIYLLLHQAARLAAAVPGLLEAVAASAKAPLDALQDAASYLRSRRDVPPSTPGEALAFDLLDEDFNCGLRIRRRPDGSLMVYTGTHWALSNTNELKARLLRYAMRNPGRYGAARASAREAFDVITAWAPSAHTLMTAKAKSVVNTLSGELWIGEAGKIELRPHRPESQLRHVLPVCYDPQATCPVFDKMLEEVFCNANEPAEMTRHLLEVSGYALQPRRDLPVITVFLGAGQNGKSKVIEILSALVGREQTWMGSLSNLNGDRFVVPDLEGKLLMIEDDAKDGVKIDDGLLKKLSENKPVDARRARASHGVTFEATAMPIIATNGTPHIEDTSKGLRRRFQAFRFDRQFQDHEQDPTIATRIIADELPGVLNRCLEGLERLRARGHFAPPQDCVEARNAFLAAANPLSAFLNERLASRQGETTRISDVWNAFVAFCRTQGHRAPCAQRQFKARLEAAGLLVRKSSVMVVADVVLLPEASG